MTAHYIIGAQIMTPRSISLFLALIMATHATSAALADDRDAVSAPSGEYRVVALRNASDVATTANPGAGTEWLDQRVSFGEGQLTWLGGETCELWSVREADFPVITLEDPNLSDLAMPPLDSITSSGDKRVNVPVDLVCQDDGEQILGSFVIIDARVLVASAPPWSVNFILEHALTEDQVKKLQAQLKDMKFYGGEITGKLDEATLRSVGYYAEYRGSKYRFFRTAITENLLDGLGVLDDAENGDEGAFRDYEPKRGADSLRDYSPEFARQIDNLPDVTFDNLSELLGRLNSLDLRASKLPGTWVDGKLALGANEKEYAPSQAEMMAAALGDRISAFVAATDPDVLARQWPADRDRCLHYKRFDIRHADVMGSGRFYYASGPIPVTIEIPEAEL